jgi:outer membrane protein insertion porin family
MRTLAALLMICAGWAGTARAQPAPASFVGRMVADVQIVTEGRPTDDLALLDLLETVRGLPLSMAEVRESIAHLYSLGRFQDVQVEASDTAAGVALRYNLIPLHSVQKVEFRGRLGLSEGLLRRTMVERYGPTPPVGRAADVARTLEVQYADHGYFRASIRPVATIRHDPDRTLLAFEVDAGPRATIGRIDVGGKFPESRELLLRRLSVSPGAPYERVALQRRLSDHVAELKARGHYQASASHRARVSDDGTVADVTIDMDAGPIVSVRFEGDTVPQAKLDELVPIKREGIADEDLIEDAVVRLAAYLNQQGYWKATVTHRSEQQDGRLTIVFSIRKGLLYRVGDEGVVIQGGGSLTPEELRERVRLRAGDVYVAAELDATVGSIAQLYRTRGFAAAKISSAANEVNPVRPGEGLVRPVVVIVEGPRTIVSDVTIAGAEHISESELRARIRTTPGSPYFEPLAATDRDVLRLEYLNRGFASAEVTATPVFSTDGTLVDLLFEVREGPQTVVDHILIVGNTHTKEQVIRRELLFQPGQPLGLEDRFESTRRLSALGLFRQVRISELAHAGGTRHDVLVTVEEAPATTIGYGGGLEATRRLRASGPSGEAEERLEFAPRGFFDIGRRNLGGRNRSVNLYTRVSLRARDVPEDPEKDGTGLGFSEYRVVGTYRQPRSLWWRADLSLTGAVEQGIRSSFNFARKGVTAEALRRITPAVRASFRYSFSTTKTFDERLSDEDQATIDRLFPRVRLSAISGAVARDTRDDVLDPSSGTFMSGEGSMAARSMGGQVGFLKSYVQGFWFRRLPGRRRVVFAARAATGLADGFPRDVQGTIVEDLPASERFFAGGDTTIRGFALDTVGTESTISATGFPRGGNAVVILNGELRIPVWREVGAAVFVDGGNVFERVTDLDFGALRGSAGFGVRYRSPIGPIRVDLGFKMDRRESAGRRETPMVVHFSIGQAF